MRIFLSLAAAAALLAACGESFDPEGTPAASQRLFRFDTAPFPGDETPGTGDSALPGVIRAYRFERGQLAEQFGPLTAAGSAAELRLARTGGTLYVVAGPDALLPEVAPGFPEAEWLDLTAAFATGLAEPFATGRLDLGELEPGTAEVPLTLTRGVARLDLHLRVAGTATVERITLRQLACEGYLFPSEAPRTPADASRSDAVCVGDAALTTDTPAIAYLYEQTGADLGVSVEAVIDGVRHTLEGVLPRDIGRNRIYSLTLRKGIVDTEARLTVEAWGDGGESALQPDLETRLTVDAERSELPSGVRIEVGGTGLVLPHAEREVLLAVRSDVQLELEPVSAPLLEIAAEPAEEGSRVWRVVGGWRPNDPTADGRQQSARLVIRSAATGEREVYTVVRRNWGLPVTWFHGVWWCKYNARGRSRNFEDQILVPQDPAAAAGQSVQNYLMSCSPEEFCALWGWAYQGDSGVGMQVVDLEGVPSMEGFTTGSKTHINKLPADALAPDGYELPSMEEFNRVFDATDYVWVMWSGSHKLRNPWEGHADVRRTQTRRNGIAVGSLELNDLLVVAFSSPDFPGYEALTWYGPGAQWNQAGIVHSNHCNNMLFAVHSPAGSGWYITGGMANLYLTQNGAGNNDTRIVRFKKSSVEYIY